MDDGGPTVELGLEVVEATLLAILVTDGSREAWLSKSLLRHLNEDVDDYDGGESTTLVLPERLAIEKELI